MSAQHSLVTRPPGIVPSTPLLAVGGHHQQGLRGPVLAGHLSRNQPENGPMGIDQLQNQVVEPETRPTYQLVI